ncbi:MAG: hypothetical protein QMB11_11290 [Nonlabens sp.]|jgi:hypothetical protein|uniref:hypothetical protein n=1 Tax=Nonlabens sp. TaxID=1888209 RepID=UPI0035A6BF3C
MKNNKYLVLAILMIATTTAYAQPGFDGDVEDAQAPIPGIVIAVIAAIGIGIVKLRKKDSY